MSNGWRKVTLVMPEAAYQLYLLSRLAIEAQLEQSANKRQPVQDGIVLEMLCAEHLAGFGIDMQTLIPLIAEKYESLHKHQETVQKQREPHQSLETFRV